MASDTSESTYSSTPIANITVGADSSNQSTSLDYEVPQDSIVWGYLTPNSSLFRSFRLVSNSITFGKQGLAESIESDQFYALKEEEFPPLFFTMLSRLHFKIERVFDGEDYDVYITDLSTNGTFVDGEKLKSGVRRPLVNLSYISIVNPQTFGGFNFELSQERGEETFEALPFEVRRDYIVGRKLNEGGSGFVHLAYRRDTSEKCAIKFISKSYVVYDEVSIMQSLKHPNVIQFQKYIGTDKFHAIVMEYANGKDLLTYINSHLTALLEKDAKFFFYQLCMGVEYLHSKDICHRDLKLENIFLLSKNGKYLLKIGDFGLSRILESNGLLSGYVGSSHYTAPEVLQNYLSESPYPYHLSADMWSLGCILYSLLCGTNAFLGENFEELSDKILSANYDIANVIEKGISDGAIDLLKNLLQISPLGRLTISEALNHSWLSTRKVKQDYEDIFSCQVPPQQAPKRRPSELCRMSKGFQRLTISGIRRPRISSSSDDQDSDCLNVAKKRRD